MYLKRLLAVPAYTNFNYFMLQRKEHSQCGLSSLSFFLGLFIVLVYVVVFVDLRAMLAHLERRLSGIPWAGRQAGSPPASCASPHPCLCLLSPDSRSSYYKGTSHRLRLRLRLRLGLGLRFRLRLRLPLGLHFM